MGEALEQFTSTITWTKYDGRPETLPEAVSPVLIHRKQGTALFGWRYGLFGEALENFPEGIGIWKIPFCDEEIEISVGDLWSYFPGPPKEKDRVKHGR